MSQLDEYQNEILLKWKEDAILFLMKSGYSSEEAEFKYNERMNAKFDENSSKIVENIINIIKD